MNQSLSNCGPWGLVMNQVMEDTKMTQEAVLMPFAWEYAKQACTRCKDINDPVRRTNSGSWSAQCQRPGYGSPFIMGSECSGGIGMTYDSLYKTPYQFAERSSGTPEQSSRFTPERPSIPGSVGAYYGILPPW